MQSNATVINKIIGTKDQGHTCLYQRVVAQNIFTFTFFQALEPRSLYLHQSSSTNIHKANKQAY
jgi:hypothetical protein